MLNKAFYVHVIMCNHLPHRTAARSYDRQSPKPVGSESREQSENAVSSLLQSTIVNHMAFKLLSSPSRLLLEQTHIII